MISEGVNITNRIVEYFFYKTNLLFLLTYVFINGIFQLITSSNRMLSQKRFLDTGLISFQPDSLHEFELGVWKATVTFTHLMRILHAYGNDSI